MSGESYVVFSKEQKEKYIAVLSSNLRLLRVKLGITQAELAEMVGVSRQTIVQAENAGKLSWSTYLALVFLFSKNPETAKLMDMFDAYPNELRDANEDFLGG